MMSSLAGIVFLSLVAAPAFAEAPSVSAAYPRRDRGAFLIGAKGGGLFAQPFSKLGMSYFVDVELGYVLPFARRSFAIVVDGGYTEPGATGGTNDPRLVTSTNPMGSYTWSLTQRQVLLGLTLMYRATFIGSGRVVPYLGVGGRVWLLQSTLVGTAGAGNPIAQSEEQSTKVGVSVPLGIDVGLGPGRIFIEGQLLWAPIDHRSTGESSVGAISAELGYRFFL